MSVSAARPLEVRAHHASLRAYDADRHRYLSAYLDQAAFHLSATRWPGGRDVVESSDQLNIAATASGSLVRLTLAEVPQSTAAYEWILHRSGKPDKIVRKAAIPYSGRAPHRFGMKLVFPSLTSCSFENIEAGVLYSVEVRQVSTDGSFSVLGTAEITVQNRILLSIGDSYASGEGLPDSPGIPKGFSPSLDWWQVVYPPLLVWEFSKEAAEWGERQALLRAPQIAAGLDVKIPMEIQPQWQERFAHRSLRSSHARAARILERSEKGRLTTFVSFARSGATIDEGLLGPRSMSEDGWIGGIGQLDEMRRTMRGRSASALFVSIGGNDVGFSPSIETLTKGVLGNATNSKIVEDALDRIQQLPKTFGRFASELRKAVQVSSTYLWDTPSTCSTDASTVKALLILDANCSNHLG